MSQQPQVSSTTPPERTRRRPRSRVVVSFLLLLLVCIALLLLGRGFLAGGARRMAAREIDAGAITRAQQWLDWSLWLDPGDGTTELMQAACCRHLQLEDRWVEAVQAAKQKGAAAQQVQLEIDLGLIRTGRLRNGAAGQLGALIEMGATPREVATAFVYGYLRREDPPKAKAWIGALANQLPDDAQVAYLRGVYWRSQRDRGRAIEEFTRVVTKHPGHELARTALAEMAEEKDLLHQALEQYVAMATYSPACASAKVGMARVLRKQGDIANGRVVLAPFVSSRPTPLSSVLVEMGHIELESGNYAAAQRWFAQVDLGEAKAGEATSAALLPFSRDDSSIRVQQLFDEVEAEKYRTWRVDALKVRLRVTPDDTEAAAELQRLRSRATVPTAGHANPPAKSAERDPSERPTASAADLYRRYCSACHGENGDGNGRAARHLWPQPHDLRTRGFRLANTVNGVPTLDDLEAVIRRGLPGTSMRAFDMLTQQQQRLLAQEVLRLYHEGIRAQVTDELLDDGEELDEEEIRQEVARRGTAGDVVRAPQIGRADAHAVARGATAYVEVGCQQCHGEDGLGERDKALFDARGHATRPRDVAYEPLKGGETPESMFLRIFLGMPGTDHPACSSLTEAQTVDLVHFCRSLARTPKRVLTNHQRSVYSTSRAYVSAFGSEFGSTATE